MLQDLMNEFWKSIHENFEWDTYPPNTDYEYMIIVFDDGNEKYEEHDNIWYKCGNWKDKVALINKINYMVTIGSISTWKIKLKE